MCLCLNDLRRLKTEAAGLGARDVQFSLEDTVLELGTF